MKYMCSREVLASYVLENVDESAAIVFAVKALTEGKDSKSLRILAGESEENFNAFEIRELLRKALHELNMTLPPLEEASRISVCHWLKRIASGSVKPREGVHRIVRDVHFKYASEKDSVHVGETLDIKELIAAYYQYDDLQEGFIEYEGETITKEEAYRVLDLIITEDANRYLAEHCG